jgi:hypothetical protein
MLSIQRALRRAIAISTLVGLIFTWGSSVPARTRAVYLGADGDVMYGSVIASGYEVSTTDGMNEKGLVAKCFGAGGAAVPEVFKSLGLQEKNVSLRWWRRREQFLRLPGQR